MIRKMARTMKRPKLGTTRQVKHVLLSYGYKGICFQYRVCLNSHFLTIVSIHFLVYCGYRVAILLQKVSKLLNSVHMVIMSVNDEN